MKKYAIGLLLFAATGHAIAIDEFSKTVGRMGIQGNNAYFSLKEGLSTNCRYGIIYIDITTDSGKLSYTNVLSSKATSSKLSWISYTQANSGDPCMLYTAEMAE